MERHPKRGREPTTTSLITEYLERFDDFVETHDFCNITGRSMNQVTAALFSLRQYKAVDVIIQPDGRGWWYATPWCDNRSRTVAETTLGIPKKPHTRPSRRRKDAT